MRHEEWITCSRCNHEYKVIGLKDDDLMYVDGGLFVIKEHPCSECGCNEIYLESILKSSHMLY